MTAIPQRIRHMVLERDDYCCVGCGQDITRLRWYSLQHRKARGQGGKNTPDNLVTLCGSATSAGCHWIAEQRDSEMIARGIVVWSFQEPSEVPLILPSGRSILLTTDGKIEEAS